MKKIYSLILFVLCVLSAQAYTFNIDIKGSEYFTLSYYDLDSKTEVVATLTDGEPFVYAADNYNGYWTVTLKDEAAAAGVQATIVVSNWYTIVLPDSYYKNTYTVYSSTTSEVLACSITAGAVQDETFKVTIDDPAAAQMKFTDATDYIEVQSSFDVTFTPSSNKTLKIMPTAGTAFYSIEIVGEKDGQTVTYQPSYSASDNAYYVYVDGTNYYYGTVKEVNIVSKYPEDLTYTVTFEYWDQSTYSQFTPTSDPLTYMIDGVTVTPVDNKLSVAPGTTITAKVNDTWTFQMARDANYNQYIYESNISFGPISSDITYLVFVKQVIIQEYKIILHGSPANVTVNVAYNPISLVQGENTITAEANSYFTAYTNTASDGTEYEWSSITFAGTEQLTAASSSFSGYLPADPCSIEMTVSEVVRDLPFVIYIDKLPANLYPEATSSVGSWSMYFSNASSYSFYKQQEGYQTCYTRYADGNIYVSAYVYDETNYPYSYAVYKDGDQISGSTVTPDENSVIKLFAWTETTPAPYNVAFTATDKALEILAGYEVKKDIVASVTIYNGASEVAVGYTEWTITPVAVANSTLDTTEEYYLTISVGGEALTADESGVYKFSTTAATSVDFNAQSSGIRNISIDNSFNNTDVYNLQGIRVATDGDVNNLPAGIYIVGGRKVVKQ